MNRIRFIIPLGLLFCISAIQAQTVNFNLTGTITPGVCRFTANDVDLGTYASTFFTAVGTTTNFVDVPITSSGCDPLVTSIHMRVTGTPDSDNTALFRGVAGVGIELQRWAGAVPIVPAGTTVDFSPVANGGTYRFQARFKRSATVTAGAVSSPVTINVTYN